MDLADAARSVREAAKTGELIAPLTERFPRHNAADAYAIQHLNTEHRLHHEGRRIVGCQVRLTVRAVQSRLGVDQPDFGLLFDGMVFGGAEPVPMGFQR